LIQTSKSESRQGSDVVPTLLHISTSRRKKVLDGPASTEWTRAKAKGKRKQAERQTRVITLMESCSSRYVEHIWEPPYTRWFTSNVLFCETMRHSQRYDQICVSGCRRLFTWPHK